MSAVLIVAVFPIEVYALYVNTSMPFVPYSWKEVHSSDHWQLIGLVPTGGYVLSDRWIQVGVGYVLFIFYGMGNDAREMYRKGLVKLGLGKLFPSLLRDRQNSSSNRSQNGSVTSKARLLIGKLKPGSRSSQ